MVAKKKSKYKLYEKEDWSQWHGAQEQARRIIEEILPFLDEAMQKSEIIQTPENLSRYISEIHVFYSNVLSIIKKEKRKAIQDYMRKLIEAKRNILSKGVTTKDYYFKLHDCASSFDRFLRDKVQEIGLLYRVVKKQGASQMLKDIEEFSNEKAIEKLITTSPYILESMALRSTEDEIEETK